MGTEKSPAFAPSVLKNAKLKFEERQKTSNNKETFDDFLKKLAASESSASLPVKVDTSYPISNYFISSSHNTYLTGNQLWSKASTDPYKDVLKRGCRCIEIDVWDGGSPASASSESEEGGDGETSDVKKLTGMVKKGLTRLRSSSNVKDNPQTEPAANSPAGDQNQMPTPWRTTSGGAEPRVLHGYTATKEIAFRKVCEVIRDYAFAKSDMPLIVSLEVHCSHEQQEVMVEIMTDYWKPYLVPMPKESSDQTPLPPLESLRKSILVKVKYSPPQRAGTKKPGKHSPKDSEEKDSSEDENQVTSSKKGKIIENLSKLGVYTRSCHFDSLDQPEAQIPTHVFALSEKKVISLQEQNKDSLFKHNLSFMMRAYPKGTRVRSSNLDPAPFWRQGIQMVALNWQQTNAAMMLNDAMFADTGGWVTKPEGYRKTKDPQPLAKRINFDLSVQVLAAQGLDPSSRTTPDVYVKCELHVGSKDGDAIPAEGKNKGGEWKRTSAVRHSKEPDFSGETLEFKGVENVVPELSFVRYVQSPFVTRLWVRRRPPLRDLTLVLVVQDRSAGGRLHNSDALWDCDVARRLLVTFLPVPSLLFLHRFAAQLQRWNPLQISTVGFVQP